MNKFVIKKKLPSLNEWWYELAANKYRGSKFKKDIEEEIGWSIKHALFCNTLHKVDKPVFINFEWHERTKRRDADNIASAKKFILDALVKNGILIDDSRKYVKGFYDKIIDDKIDYVVVELIEV